MAAPELQLEFTPTGKTGRGSLVVRINGQPLFADELKICSSEARKKFVKAFCSRHSGVAPEQITDELDLIAAQAAPSSSPGEQQPPTPQVAQYECTDHGLVWHKPTPNGSVPVQLTNFRARIVTNLAYDDGGEVSRSVEVEATTIDGCHHRFTIPASRFSSMNWVTECLGSKAILSAGTSAKDHARAAIQTLSQDADDRAVYAHTGWRQIAGKWVFLHGAGAIGSVGSVSGVDIDLGEFLKYALPSPPSGQALVAAVRASLSILEIAPPQIVLPMICAAYRAPLGASSTSVYLSGATGKGKSELAALIQQHFGPEMHAKQLPGSFLATANSLEGRAFQLKDTIFVIDDFAPAGSKHSIDKMHETAQRIFRAQGNRAGRTRMRPDGTIKPTKPPRSLILATGEDIPRTHSILARLFVLEIKEGDLDWEKLTGCQREAADGRFAEGMAGYIQWLAPQYEDIRKSLSEQKVALRQTAECAVQHKRTIEIAADLGLGLQYFLRFACEIGAITEQEATKLWEEGWRTLLKVAAGQESIHGTADPVIRFLELLASAIDSGRAHLGGVHGQEPRASWGWRDGQPLGDRVGWLDGEDVYLNWDAAYRIVQAQAGTNEEGIAPGRSTLLKRLNERGLLKCTESQDRLKIRRLLEGRRVWVVHLDVSDLSISPKVIQVSQVSQERDNSCDSLAIGITSVDQFSNVDQELATKVIHNSLSTIGTGSVGSVGSVSEPYKTVAAREKHEPVGAPAGAPDAAEIEERAAIMEVDGHLPRDVAEACARGHVHPTDTELAELEQDGT